jgi:hypothetical protein
MRLTLSSLAITTAAVTSVLFAIGAVYLLRSTPDEDALLEKLLIEAQREIDQAPPVSRTVQVYLLGDGKLSYASEEMTLDTFASRVDLEGWDAQTNVQILLAGGQVGGDNVRLLELLARRGVVRVHILPPSPGQERQR